MKWYKHDPNAARIAWLRRKYGPECCGEFPMYAHVPHFVYLVGAENSPVKIGLCRDLAKRLSTLRSACPFPIDVYWSAWVRSREIAREMEIAACNEFPRVNGEWLAVDATSVIRFLEA